MENLTLPLSTFQMTDEQRIEIESRMSRCSGCRKWKYNEHLDGSKCGKCGGEVDLSKKPKARRNETAITERIRKQAKRDMSERDEALPPLGNSFLDTIYLSMRGAIKRGMSIKQAREEYGVKMSDYHELPREYRNDLMDCKKEKTKELKNSKMETTKRKEGKRRRFDDETKKQILREHFASSKKKNVLRKWDVTAANISQWKAKFGENPQPAEQGQIDFDKPVEKKKLVDKKVIIIEVEEDGEKTIVNCSHTGFKSTVDLIGVLETTKLNLLKD